MTDRVEAQLADLVARRYADPGEVEHYRRRAGDGLRAWEAWVCQRQVRAGARVLDVGCGAGREALALAERGCRVVGVDIGRELLASARAQARMRGIALSLCRTDGRVLPFADGSFDHVALWSQVLANVPGAATRAALLAEARRVLVPEGSLSFSVHDRARTEALAGAAPLSTERADTSLAAGDLIIRDSSASGTACYWHYFTPDEIRALCSDAGLRVLHCARASALGDPDRDNLWICIGASS